MKILFLTNGNLPDYMADVIFHGGRTLWGADFIDYPRINYMYKDYGDTSQLYGRGMTLFGLLPSDADVDRTDIVKKLQNREFDYVWYGSIQRCQTYFGGVTSSYPKGKIVMIDGEDSPISLGLQAKGMIFKRELCGTLEGFYPVHFGIPAEKILKTRPEKTRFMAEYDPLINRGPYIYDTEAEFYNNYKISYFAPTMRKMGFDCMRHYEILANWALPYFRAVDGVPDTAMHRYPKKECDLVRRLIEYGPAGCETAIDLYDRIIEPVMEIVRTKLTTESVTQYVLDTVIANK